MLGRTLAEKRASALTDRRQAPSFQNRARHPSYSSLHPLPDGSRRTVIARGYCSDPPGPPAYEGSDSDESDPRLPLGRPARRTLDAAQSCE